MRLDFAITGNIRQEILIFPEYKDAYPDAVLLAALKSGAVCTTVSHDGAGSRIEVIRFADGATIGCVESQEALDDVEFTDMEDPDIAQHT